MNEALRQEIIDLPGSMQGHLNVSLAALAIGLAVSLPVGVLAYRQPRWRGAALAAASVVQTIPALAMLALMLPLFVGIKALLPAAVGVRATGFGPAVAALSLYSILPMLRNTVTGLAGVDAAAKEAARGLGMTSWQTLRRVELPLALPVIVAGVRTATVWVVGMATLATLIGQSSLGDPIISGLHLRNWTSVVFGCVLAALLALALDGLVGLVERGLSGRNRPAAVGALIGVLLVLGVGYFGPPLAARAAAGTADVAAGKIDRDLPTVRIGGKPFTEQHILVELLARRLSAAGFDVERVENLGSTVGFDALSKNEIDLFVDYSGTIWAAYMGQDGSLSGERMLDRIDYWLGRQSGVRSLGSLGFENAYCLAMPEAEAERLGIRTIADLADHMDQLTLGSDYEFVDRPEWRQVRDAYGLQPDRIQRMDPSLMYQALNAGEVDVIPAYSSDGRIAAYDLRVLEDLKEAFPPYDAVLLVSPRLAEFKPLIEAVWPLIGAIDLATMQRANLMVDRQADRRSAREAAAWLDGRLQTR